MPLRWTMKGWPSKPKKLRSPPVTAGTRSQVSPWHRPHYLMQVLVAGDEGGHSKLCLRLFGLCPSQGNPPTPQGLLQPFLIPHRPWSHIALDFVTGLPTSNHNTTILTIRDRLGLYILFPSPNYHLQQKQHTYSSHM